MKEYKLDPNTKYCISFSGGRSSAYMLRNILLANNGVLPDNAVCVFNNTGKEREETLAFVNEVSVQWKVPIVWVEYWYDTTGRGVKGNPRQKHRVVTFETASRNGEPFADLIKTKKFLPNTARRICTSELKVNTSHNYLYRDLGWKRWVNVLGIRADEGKRASRLFVERVCSNQMPLYTSGVTKKEVDLFWSQNSFDLGIPSHLGNCDLCFLKGHKNLINVLRREPEKAQWWIEQEAMIRSGRDRTPERNSWFGKDMSVADMLKLAQNQSDLFDNDSQPEEYDCFCGD